MSFLNHLEVMRWHLLRSLAAIVIIALVAFVFKDIVFDKILLAPKEPSFPTNRWLCHLSDLLGLKRLCINSDPLELQTIQMAEQFTMHIIVSLVAGIIVAFPYIFWEFWRFVIPALYEKEKRTATGAVFYISLLFILGVSFGYFIISPLSINFLGNYKVSESVTSAPTLRSYIEIVTRVILAAGIVFQLPVLVYFLSEVGLVTPDLLKKYRRHSIVLIVTLSAIITPPDLFSQVLVSLPLLVLYEIGIGISRRIMKRQEAEFADDDKSDKKSDTKSEKKSDEKGDTKSDKEGEKKSDVKGDKKSDTKSDVKDEKKSDKKSDTKSDDMNEEEGGDFSD